MKSFISRIGFPAAFAAMVAVHTVTTDPAVNVDRRIIGVPIEVLTERPDTVIYPLNGYKRGWTEEDFRMDASPLGDSLFNFEDSLGLADSLAVTDTLPRLAARLRKS